MSIEKKTRRRDIVISAIVLVTLAISLRGLPELYALGWHALNGSNATVGVYEVPIPIWSIGSKDISTLNVHTGNRRKHTWLGDRWDHINTISFSSKPELTAEERKSANQRIEQRLGVEATLMSDVVVAGSQMTCFKNTYPNNRSVITINCLPKDPSTALQVFYRGDTQSEQHFYRQLERVKRKS